MADWFVAEGEAGRALREYDWSSTPLGPLHSWPQSLRTAVNFMVAARQPAYIAWGAELWSMYNDSYLPIVGDKHPASMGMTFEALWAEIWDEYRPYVEKVRAGQAQFWVDQPVMLSGRPNRPVGWFTFSWTPLRDEQGAIAGFLCVGSENTERVLAERQLVESMDEGFCIIEIIFDEAANPVDYRFIRTNPAFVKQTGLQDAEGKLITELVPDIERHWIETNGKVALTGQPIRFVNEARSIGKWFDVYTFRIAGSFNRVGSLFRDITERKQAEEKVRHASLHDSLTGLPNRAMLFEYAARLLPHNLRVDTCAALLFLDLDRFKPINDMHGHETGDEVLKEVARRLSHSVRAEDIVIRLGGDEFVILLQDIKNASYAGEVASHIITTVNEPYLIHNLALSLSTSIGISIFPGDGQDIDTLISHADAAMYQAKQAGRNNFQFYSAESTHGIKLQLAIEQQLRSALRYDNFHLCYQPVLDLENGNVVSVEALIRWSNADIGPEQFVPIAEATGIINPIGRWVLKEASRQHKAWIAEGLPAIPIAVNVSVVEFRDRDFVSRFERLIGEYGIEPTALQIEVTETAVMDDIEHAIKVLSQLKAMGVIILLDDFGTGYSSLAHLARLPLNKIKIDKSFVSQLEDDLASRAITDAMLTLGRTLGLEVVAEGVESAIALDYLRARGCRQAQGFIFSKPISGEGFQAWCRNWGSKTQVTQSASRQKCRQK